MDDRAHSGGTGYGGGVRTPMFVRSRRKKIFFLKCLIAKFANPKIVIAQMPHRTGCFGNAFFRFAEQMPEYLGTRSKALTFFDVIAKLTNTTNSSLDVKLFLHA